MTRSESDTGGIDAEYRLEALASVVSHDLRNPLNVAQSSLDLLEVEGPHADRIDRSLDRMERIIEDVVTLARLEETVENPAPVDVGTMATDAWRRVETGDAALEIEIDRQIVADADRLRETFVHLFHNAVEHAPPEEVDADTEPITVTVGSIDGGLYVADDGRGIDPDDRESVFETGYTTGRGGTGLGLPIVRGIARSHGWNIELAESDAGGARFEVTEVTFTDG